MNTRYSPYDNQNINVEESPTLIQKLVKNILKLFNKTPKNERYAVLSIVAGEISKKELRKTGFTFSNTMYRTAKRKRVDEIENRDFYQPESKKQKGDDIKELINEYLTKYSETTCKIHRNQPVLNLQRSKLYIHKKMISENPEINLSLSTYYKLCPKRFKYVKKKTDMCDICVNGKKLERSLGENSQDKRVKFYKAHVELNKDQKSYFKQKLENLEHGECVVVMDFKQNFKIGGGPVEISQAYYNKSSVSCLGFCVIYKVAGKVKRRYYNYLSEIISHDSHYVKSCLRKLEETKLRSFSKINFWSDNAGHFRSEELRSYILLELPTKNYSTSQNFFAEYHGKSDIDGHFGLLQRVFNEYERKNDVTSIYVVAYCFWEFFLEADTDAYFEIYEDPGREDLVQRLRIKDAKQYMSLYSDEGTIYGNSVSLSQGSSYRRVGHEVVCSRERRENKYAPKLKADRGWTVSSSQLKIMGKRVVLKS